MATLHTPGAAEGEALAVCGVKEPVHHAGSGAGLQSVTAPPALRCLNAFLCVSMNFNIFT